MSGWLSALAFRASKRWMLRRRQPSVAIPRPDANRTYLQHIESFVHPDSQSPLNENLNASLNSHTVAEILRVC
jgi:hypothetical protein